MEERIYQGYIYRRAGPGEAWQLAGPAPTAQQPQQGMIVRDPSQPYDVQLAQAQAQEATATAPYAGRLAAAQTAEAETAARARADKAAADAAAAEEDRRQQIAKRSGQRAQSDVVLKNIEEARSLIEGGRTAGFSSLLAGLPATRARRLSNVLDTLRANLTFDRLQQMRDESKTGGAVGNASDADMRLLGSTTGSLDQGQAPEDLMNVLNDVEGKYLGVIADIEGMPRQDFVAQYAAQKAQEQQRSQEQNQDTTPAVQGYSVTPEGRIRVDITPNDTPTGGAPATPYADSPLSQGLSGVNEGIAATLGLPVDAANAAVGLGAQGLNWLTGSDIQPSETPFLGSEWWRGTLGDMGSIAPEGGGTSGEVSRRIGQSLGAAAIPIGAGAQTARGLGTGLLAALGGGTGGAIAEQAFPDSTMASIAGELLGSGLTGSGLFLGARRGAQRTAEAAIPSVQELKDQAGELYRAAERGGVTAPQGLTQGLAQDFRQIAIDEGLVSPTGRISEAYPKAREALRLVDDYAQGEMTPTQMQSVRKVLSDAAGSPDNSERRIATMMLRQFDDFTAPLAPELAQARQLYSRALSGQNLETARGVAEANASGFSGSGVENALRTQYRALDRGIEKGTERGFNPAVIEAIQNVSRGTPAGNVARGLGRLAPTGIVSGSLSTGIPFSIGTAIGGPAVGALAGASVPAFGGLARNVATGMTSRNAEIAELLARAGGPIVPQTVVPPDVQRMIAAQLAAQVNQSSGIE